MADTLSRYVSPQMLYGSIDPFNFNSVYLPLVQISDNVPPSVVVNVVTPNPLLKDSWITVDVTDALSAIKAVFIMAFWAGRDDSVWDGNSYSATYAGSLAPVTIAGGFRFQFKPALGWPVPLPVDQPNMRVRIAAVDSAGNVSIP